MILGLVLFSAVGWLGPLPHAALPPGDGDGDGGVGPKPSDIDRLVAGMTAEEKVGQLFMVGIPGVTGDAGAARLIRDYHVGGIILFRGNLTSIAQAVALTNDLKRLAQGQPLPLFIAADQEGGPVQRLPPGATSFPAARDVGDTLSVPLANRIGLAMGEELRALGFNADLAPVMDVDTNPENPVIGNRAFSSDPAEVALMGGAVIGGLRAAGVVSCVKHFPGHGDTSVDSHLGLPRVDHGRSRLDRVELVPFWSAVLAGTDMVMPGHIVYTKLDPSGKPASLSRPIITGLLRGEMGYDGVVITDSLAMEAITGNYPRAEALLGALDAGADILLLPGEPEALYQAIEVVRQAVASGRITAGRLDQSVRRIAELKARYRLDWQPVDAQEATAVLGRPWHKEVVAEVLSR